MNNKNEIDLKKERKGENDDDGVSSSIRESKHTKGHMGWEASAMEAGVAFFLSSFFSSLLVFNYLLFLFKQIGMGTYPN